MKLTEKINLFIEHKEFEKNGEKKMEWCLSIAALREVLIIKKK